MSESITIEMVYREVKNIREMLEELAEKALTNVIPEEEIGEEEWRELKNIEGEMKRGEYATLEEAERKIKPKRNNSIRRANLKP